MRNKPPNYSISFVSTCFQTIVQIKQSYKYTAICCNRYDQVSRKNGTWTKRPIIEYTESFTVFVERL